MQNFNIDISNPSGPLVLYAMQGDAMSRFFSVTVTDSGAAYEPPDGAVYTVRFGAPGMPAGWYDTIEDTAGGTHAAVVADGNIITVELAEQAVSKPGKNEVVLIISDAAGYTLASWAFALQVAAVPGYDAPEATVYYNALSEQVAQVLSSVSAAQASVAAAEAKATLAESWAVGGTGTRPGEDTNNAEYWAQQAQQVSQGALGWYETEQALEAAHPTGSNGQWAIIGSTDTIWTWDSDTSAWVNSGAQMDLSDYYTKEQANAAFATTAQGAKADTAVQSVNGKTGTSVTLDAEDVGAVQTVNGRSGPAVTLVPELLWTNPAPGQAFEGQSVSFDTKNYTWFIVQYAAGNGNRFAIVKRDVLSVLVQNTYYNYCRTITISTNTALIRDCTYYPAYGNSQTSTYNSGCLPSHIYGLM